jgi:hypothetical protein
VLAVWSGAALGALTQVGCNDQDSSTVGPARLSLPVSAGQTYRLQVAGGYAFSPYGTFALDLSLDPPVAATPSP